MNRGVLRLCASDNTTSDECAPTEWHVGSECVWPFQDVMDKNELLEIKDLDKKFGTILFL